MLDLKKYFTEGLVQVAILFSLCGVRVDVGLEPYLPPSWHERILGQTSALTPMQFHNLRDCLADSHDLPPKSVDLDGFFTARRLLGWVRSLDRIQVPHAELETWLVQREPESQSSPLERAPAGQERDRLFLPVESRARHDSLQEEEMEDKEEGALEEEEEHLHRMTDSLADHREPTQNEAHQTSLSLQECLRLLEETFPLAEEQQECGVGDVKGDLDGQPPGSESQLSHITSTENSSSDFLCWQDLLAIMEPENTDVDMMTSFDCTENSGATGSEASRQNSEKHGIMDAYQEALVMESPLQHGVLGPPRTSELEPVLLPLRPSAELDGYNSALNLRGTSADSDLNLSLHLPDHTYLLEEDPSEDFCMELKTEDNSGAFNINLLTQGPVDTMEGSPLETLPPFDNNFYSPYLLTPSPEGNGMISDLQASPSSTFPIDELEDVDDEDGLPSPLSDLLVDAVILDEMRLLDLALEEGFSPEMAAKLEEEGFLGSEVTQQETGREDQQDGEDKADSDSGLSLDFSLSPVSLYDSESSSYSSSSNSFSSTLAAGSPVSEYSDSEAEEWSAGSDMEVEVIIKQEDVEEEEMGAVGGVYAEDVKKPFLPNYRDHMYNGFPWYNNVGHDHTYNQPWLAPSSPSLGRMPSKSTRSSLSHNSKHNHRSSSRHIPDTEMWSRDERRARGRKIPFSNELIVNLPVEEYNDLLANYQLSKEQLTLIRDIRRRGKNKIAAQNCRKRKLDVLLELEESVSSLKQRRSRLLRERQEALRNLQEMKQRLDMLYQNVFSTLRDEQGMPLNAMDYMLHFESDGSITVASCRQGVTLPMPKNNKKKRDKKK